MPGDERLSRRDLWEPQGETPSGYPTITTTVEHWSRTRDKSLWSRRETARIAAVQGATIGHEA